MRPLTDEETKAVFEKLVKYIGQDVTKLLSTSPTKHVFRLHNNRVYYLSEDLLKLSSNVASENLIYIGTLFGKFTKKRNFRLTVHCLDTLSDYAKHKVWVKSSSEMSFLYGHHITKAGVSKVSDSIEQYSGVIVYNSKNVPLGFGVSTQSCEAIKTLEPTGIMVLHQVDVGEYLRDEQHIS
eukprot:maker-scaffold_17-snap-gene-6.70-mRNA-1 protein AED:0.33 eAED:0.33 QI:58/1/1/1/1/1/2/39/180